jgi:hypothetical protein
MALSSVVLGLSSSARPAAAEGTAFYYGRAVPAELWQAYDQVVVEPAHAGSLAALGPHRAEPVAYFSIGEVARASELAKDISSRWVLGQNPHWASWVMDPAHPGYQAHVFGRFEALWKAGYRRFFLDTLDSYQLVARSEDERARAQGSLAFMVRQMRRRHPECHLLINRGFELLPAIAPYVHGVVAESLFDRWDAGTKSYTRVPEADREWLEARLVEVRDAYHLPVTVIDYRPPKERLAARDTARRIAALGFEPWVTDAALSSLGVGATEVLPRRVLILVDALAQPGTTRGSPPPAAAASPAFEWLGPVVEYLGYVPEARRLGEGPLEPNIAARYRGVITWFTSSRVPEEYAAWMQAQIDDGVRFAMFGSPGFDLEGSAARKLGIEVLGAASPGRMQASRRDSLVGFEAEPPTGPLEVPRLRFLGTGVTPHLQLRDESGAEGTAVATTAWGGAALSHVFATRGLAGERAWVIDPFAFLTSALGLPIAPSPDLTTENGRRLALWLVRARGLGEPTRLPGRPRTADVLEKRLWSMRGWPHAIDLSSSSPPPSEEDRKSARALLNLPFAEASALPPGLTRVRDDLRSLTGVQPFTNGRDVFLPIASDLHFFPPGSPEAYPYARVRQTLELTDSPRRLKPILLDYHAFIASSPGGLSVLGDLYGWLAESEVYPLRVSEYVARVRAFGDQVLLQYLDGGFGLRGGEALGTVRVPVELGYPDLAASPAVASFRRLPQGQYVSFKPGRERRLVLTPRAPRTPYLVQANGKVTRFDVLLTEAGLAELALRVQAHARVEIEIAGLPVLFQCAFRDPARGRQTNAAVDPNGHLSLLLDSDDTGDAVLSCRPPKEDS